MKPFTLIENQLVFNVVIHDSFLVHDRSPLKEKIVEDFNLFWSRVESKPRKLFPIDPTGIKCISYEDTFAFLFRHWTGYEEYSVENTTNAAYSYTSIREDINPVYDNLLDILGMLDVSAEVLFRVTGLRDAANMYLELNPKITYTSALMFIPVSTWVIDPLARKGVNE